MAEGNINLRDNVSHVTINSEYCNQTIHIARYGPIVAIAGEITTSKDIPAYTDIIKVPQPIYTNDFLCWDNAKNITAACYVSGTGMGARHLVPSNTVMNFTFTYICL